MPRDKLEFVEGVRVNPYDPANANRAIPNLNKPFAMDASGNIVPNRAYQDYEIRKASARAAQTNVNVDCRTKAFWSDFGKNATDVLLLSVTLRRPPHPTVQSIRKSARRWIRRVSKVPRGLMPSWQHRRRWARWVCHTILRP